MRVTQDTLTEVDNAFYALQAALREAEGLPDLEKRIRDAMQECFEIGLDTTIAIHKANETPEESQSS